MRREHVERIVEVRLGAPLQHQVARNRGEAAKPDRIHRSDVSGCRRDRDETDHDRGRGADGGRLSGADVIEERPDEQRRCRGEERRGEGERRDVVRGERAARVESEPSEPEDARAEQRERHIVRQQRRRWILAAVADRDGARHGGHRRVDVHDGAAREVERAHLRQPAAAPHPVRDRRVDDDAPEGDEEDVGGEAHPLDDRAGDKRGGDDGERCLIRHVEHVRDGAERLQPDASQEHVRQIANPLVSRRERQRVGDERPDDAGEGERDETHHHRVQRVLRAHEAAVEERQHRGHQQHQCRRAEHPRGISLVHASPRPAPVRAGVHGRRTMQRRCVKPYGNAGSRSIDAFV